MTTALTVAAPAVVLSREEADFMPVMAIGRAIDRYNAVLQFTQQIMKAGKDFGEIPGTDKPTLLKPGAEKLCSFFGLTPRFTIVEKVETWDAAEPFFYFFYKCQLLRGERVIGEGEGSSNSRESKHRYRWVNESQLPKGVDKAKFEARDGVAVEFDFAVQKAETSGKYGKSASYWQAFKDAIAGGTAERVKKEIRGEPKPAWKIGSTVYRIPNPDIADQVNTLQKMAQKRSFIAATLIACNASEYYTQDVEDMQEVEPERNIDTGPHPANTQAAANYVAEKKVDEMRQQQASRPAPQLAEPVVSEEVQRMWSEMKDIRSMISVFTGLKKSLCTLIGQDAGERKYYQALGNQGAEHANQFRSTKPARAAAREILEAIHAAGQGSDSELYITEADAIVSGAGDVK